MKKWWNDRTVELSSAKSGSRAKGAPVLAFDAEEPLKSRGPAATFSIEVRMIQSDLSAFAGESAAANKFVKDKTPKNIVLPDLDPYAKNATLTVLDGEGDVELETDTVVTSKECEIESGIALDDNWLAGQSSRMFFDTEDETAEGSLCVINTDPKRPTTGGELWERRVKVALNFNPVCFHDLLQLPCNPGCPGKGNKNLTDMYFAIQYLLSQTKDGSERHKERAVILQASLAKVQRETKARGDPYPPLKPTVNVPATATERAPSAPRRDAPRPPARDKSKNDSQGKGGHSYGPRRDLQLVKKHQYHETVSALDLDGRLAEKHDTRDYLSSLSDVPYENQLAAFIADHRHQTLYHVTTDTDFGDQVLNSLFDPRM
jgi:hypothetical protein